MLVEQQAQLGSERPMTFDGSPSMPSTKTAAAAVERERAGHLERLAGGDVGVDLLVGHRRRR